uniref:fibronectin type III domain-containing protein n=1 Tax=Pedobacter schmidteae TaxID=2201271 RepID=UPI0013CEB498|nr:hypothetical protein [Pedobacter schmidteae]
MSVLNKFPVKRLVFALVLLLTAAQVDAQNTAVNVHAGPKGIWVLCGNQLPKDFSYRVLRKKGNEDWVKMVDLTFPKNKEEIQAEMLTAQHAAGLVTGPLSDTRLNQVWERLKDAVTISLPIEMQNDYPLRKANGTAWFDAKADSAVGYAYKVQLIGQKEEVVTESVSKTVSYPGKVPEADMLPMNLKSVKGSIIGEFNIAEKDGMNSCKVFRSYYLKSGFEEIQAEPIFLKRDSNLILQFTDKTAVEKVAYSYAVRPVDAAGNVGGLSEALNAFNVAENTIVPSVTNFKTTSVEKEKAIKLSWKLKDNKDVVSIDIFKGAAYDGDYVKIASVSAKDTAYLDYYAKPIETYYYTIRLNGTYEKSPTSPRISGILKSSNGNYFPPRNLRLVQEKNLVHLSWERTEDDTRAYYVYRSIGNTTKMEQVGPILITDSAQVSYTDTLPVKTAPGTYAYAVADQNTSYIVSGITRPVFAYTQGTNALPIPHDLSVLKLSPGMIQIVWANMQTESRSFGGYRLYRRAMGLNGIEIEPLKPLNTHLLNATANSYVDSTATAKEGMTYYYSLKTVAEDEATMSSSSLEAGITIYPAVVNGVANVRVLLSGKTVAIKWDNPIGDDLKHIKVFRMEGEKEDAEEMATLNAAVQSFTDAKVTTGHTYYYQLQIENKQGKKSRLTDAVGIKIYE